ncbi:MAG: hypothetical protein PHV16_02415 [Candidatus Nanoarchaeia archaeon]|nr:hypothetical protein [Candidatus Nanoarchaeia archaeon]
MKNISKDIPLAEITLRKYERPQSLKKRELVRKLCLSIGLLQPGDSRDVVVDVLYVLLEAKKQKKTLSSEEIKEKVIKTRKKHNLPLLGIAASNIRRQIRRMRSLFIVEKVNSQYRISEFFKIQEIFCKKIEESLIPEILGRIKEYIESIDELFEKKGR